MSEKQFNLHFEMEANGRIIMVGAEPVMDMPWQKADEFARSLTIMARRAEEFEKRAIITMDNALLQRSGANIGLSDRADINNETVKEALYNNNLRRLQPWRQKNVSAGIESIRSRGSVGAPALTKHKPTELRSTS